MKQLVYISLAAVCFVAAVSCSKQFQGAEPESVSGEEQLVELTASLQPHVRTYLNAEFKTRWNDGDVVAVFDGQKRQFDMTANSGASATFSGRISTEATTVYAVYPFSGAQSEDGGDYVTVNIPAEQIIAEGESTARGALVAVSKVTSLGSGVSFKNVVGLVKVTLGEGIASVKLTGANNEGIAGNVQVNAADGSLVGSPSGSSVVIKPVSGTFAAGDYYIAVAPVTLADGFTLTFHNQYSASAKKVGTNPLAIPQNGGKDLGNVTTGLVFPSGLPCGWNFYAAGYTSDSASLTSLSESENGQHWIDDGYLLPTSGINADARLTAVTTKDANIQRTFNPSIQFNGMAQNDYWLVTIPVKNFVKDVTRFTIEMGAGGAASGAGIWLLGYSTNGSSWTGFGNYYSITRGEYTVNAHLWTTYSTISASGYTNLRKQYVKKSFEEDTDTEKYSYKKYTFTSPVSIADGTLYLRLRTWYSGNQSDRTKPKNTSWTDLKGFEVSFAED